MNKNYFTLARVNSKIKKLGLELIQYKGEEGNYFYFVDFDGYQHPQAESINVHRLNHLSLEQWVAYAKEESKSQKEWLATRNAEKQQALTCPF